MKKEEIILWDLKRIFLGQAPPEFLLEVLIRTLLVYLCGTVIIRLLGKRMNGQISILEMSVMVLMGAILSLPMQVPDRGIVQGMVALLTVLLLLRGINWLSFRKPKWEGLIHGRTIMLVKDGILQLQELRDQRISRQQLYGVLRSKQITNLGQVKRMYLEAYGSFSVYTANEIKAGLSLLPPNDTDLGQHLNTTPDKVCADCGWIKPVTSISGSCPNCGADKWTSAVKITHTI